ncbi:hypothetical protein M405DRAFT_816495 [Rhizopogon salebrosus TDB-379]|nr:hypothetical protein M405DRAFT_816495 [Rhizopogon salebrosus TDB-379]
MSMWSCPAEPKGRKLCIGNLGDRAVTPWFDAYLVSSGKALFARPCESTLRESEFYDRAILFVAQVRQVLDSVGKVKR